jgi:hypothetical protein
MYCPSCGTPAPTDQKFCRSCGLNLQIHAQMLAGQPPVTEPDKTPVEELEGLHHRRRRMQFWGYVTSIGGMAVTMLSALVYAVVKEEAGMMEPITALVLGSLIGIGILTLFVGFFLRGYSIHFFSSKASGTRWSPELTARPQSQPTTKLLTERQPNPVPSVTEHTTDLLETSETNIPGRITARERG